YTHLGGDPDNHRWNYDTMMNRKNLPVIEGLAQYYTDIISERIGDRRRPEIHLAYLKLRRRQRGVYRIHDQWIENYSPAVMVHALYQYRPSNVADFILFCRMLDEAKQRLPGKERKPHPRVIDDINNHGSLSSYECDTLNHLLVQVATDELRYKRADQSLI